MNMVLHYSDDIQEPHFYAPKVIIFEFFKRKKKKLVSSLEMRNLLQLMECGHVNLLQVAICLVEITELVITIKDLVSVFVKLTIQYKHPSF